MMTPLNSVLLFAILAACAGPQTPAPDSTAGESVPAVMAEAEAEPASEVAALHTHGFDRVWTLPRGFANPTRESAADLQREDRGMSVTIVDGVAFARRHFSQEPRVEEQPIPHEQAQRYLDAVAAAYPALGQEGVERAGVSRHFTRALTVDAEECLVPESQGECTYYGLSVRSPDAPTSDNEVVYQEAWNAIIDLTASLVDEVLPLS